MLTTPGLAPPRLTHTSRTARPMVALARQPGPKTPAAQLTPSFPRTGPLITTSGVGALVVAETPCRSNAGSQMASTAAMTTGRYSGRQPAITALIAIFSTVAGAHSGGIEPITSCGSRLVPSSILSTRSAVGGTMGNPSLSFSRQNQSLTASRLSSTSMMLEVKFIVKDSNRNCSRADRRALSSSHDLFPSPLRGRIKEGGIAQGFDNHVNNSIDVLKYIVIPKS